MNNLRIKVGIFVAILGIAGIIVSQTTHFTKKVYYPEYMLMGILRPAVYADEPNPELNNGILYTGIAVLILGAGIAAFSSSEKK